VAFDGFGTWTFELHAEIAQEARVPFVFVGFEEFVRLFVREEVQDQSAKG
jgi:hypothetical protein